MWFSHSFTRCPEMFEQSLMCDVGNTIGYAHDGAPLTGKIQIPAWQQEAIAEVQAGASDFLEYWARHIRTRPMRPDHLKPLIRYIVVRALTSLTEAELGAFGSWVHDENFGSSKTRTLADCRLPDVYLRHASAHQLASLRSADVYWVFGLAHRLSLVLGEAVRCIFLRKAHGDAFSAPLPKASLRFLWNDGEYRQTESEVQISNCGAVWSRYTLQFRQACLCSIGLELQQHPAGFELTGAALRLTRLGHDEETLWIGAGSFRSPDGLTAVRGKELQPNTPYSAAVEDIQDFTGVVHIDVFFRGRLREYE